MYLAPQNIPSPVVLTMGNKSVLYKREVNSLKTTCGSPCRRKLENDWTPRDPDTHISCQELKFTVEMAIVRF